MIYGEDLAGAGCEVLHAGYFIFGDALLAVTTFRFTRCSVIFEERWHFLRVLFL